LKTVFKVVVKEPHPKHFDLKTYRHEWIFFYLHLAGENISNLPSKKQGVRTEKNWEEVGDQLTKDARTVCNCWNFNQHISLFHRAKTGFCMFSQFCDIDFLHLFGSYGIKRLELDVQLSVL